MVVLDFHYSFSFEFGIGFGCIHLSQFSCPENSDIPS